MWSQWGVWKSKFVSFYCIDKIIFFGIIDILYVVRICQFKDIFIVLEDIWEVVVFFFCYCYYFDCMQWCVVLCFQLVNCQLRCQCVELFVEVIVVNYGIDM